MACAKGCVQIHGIHGIHVIFMDRIHGMQKGLRADSWHSDISFSWTAFMACMSFSWEAFNLKQWKLCKNSDWKWLARLEAVPAPVSSNASPIVCGTHQSRRHVNCHCYNRTCFLIDCHVKFISKWLTWTFCWGRTLFGPSTAWHKAWHLDDMLTCSMVMAWHSLIQCITTCLGQTSIAGALNCHCYNSSTCFQIDCHVKFIRNWHTWKFCLGQTLFGPSTAWHKAWHLDDMLTCSMVTWWQLTMTTRSMILVTWLFHGCL